MRGNCNSNMRNGGASLSREQGRRISSSSFRLADFDGSAAESAVSDVTGLPPPRGPPQSRAVVVPRARAALDVRVLLPEGGERREVAHRARPRPESSADFCVVHLGILKSGHHARPRQRSSPLSESNVTAGAGTPLHAPFCKFRDQMLRVVRILLVGKRIGALSEPDVRGSSLQGPIVHLAKVGGRPTRLLRFSRGCGVTRF